MKQPTTRRKEDMSMKATGMDRRLTLARIGVALFGSLAAVALPGCASAPPPDAQSLGIRVDGLRLSAHGHLLDLRYRVLDPIKAAPLLDAKKKVYLVDEQRQARLGVPESPVIGGMRQTSRNRVVYTDRDYFILFVNPGRAVRTGDTLQLAVDGAAIARLTVQ
ncbi:MAG: hypothetical protein JWP22_2916 [Ramlibacter sp.]|jgi:hypothetical protein|nr:hypothetical protein [Ramlibacter sp.]MDB5914241.1 hypothetical protein [Ramlibacter sp.]